MGVGFSTFGAARNAWDDARNSSASQEPHDDVGLRGGSPPEPSGAPSLDDLPEEIIQRIASNLPEAGIERLSQVNQRLQGALAQETQASRLVARSRSATQLREFQALLSTPRADVEVIQGVRMSLRERPLTTLSRRIPALPDRDWPTAIGLINGVARQLPAAGQERVADAIQRMLEVQGALAFGRVLDAVARLSLDACAERVRPGASVRQIPRLPAGIEARIARLSRQEASRARMPGQASQSTNTRQAVAAATEPDQRNGSIENLPSAQRDTPARMVRNLSAAAPATASSLDTMNDIVTNIDENGSS